MDALHEKEDLLYRTTNQSSNFASEIIKLKNDVKELQDRLIDRTATFLKRDAEQTKRIRDLDRLCEYLEEEAESLHQLVLDLDDKC